MHGAATNPLREALRASRPAFLVLAAFSFAINLLVLTSPLYMMQVFDRVLSSGRLETLFFLTLIAGALVLGLGLLEVVRGRILIRIGRWLERRLAPELVTVSLRAKLAGESLGSQPLRDLATIRGFLSGAGVNALLDAPWVPVFIVIIALLHPWLGLIALVSALLLFAVAVVNEAVARHPIKEAAKRSIVAMQRVDAAMRNAEVVHAMGMRPDFLRRWTEVNGQALALQVQAGDRNALLLGFSKFLRLFVQILILGCGAWLVLRGQLTSGGMIAASILLGRALAPVEQSIGAWKGLVSARDARDRLDRMFERQAPAPETMRLPAPVGRLDCAQLMFLPRGQSEPILRGVSFALEAGECLGLIGPSAAGKSSLCKILVGTWQPTRGHARLDGADIHSWDADSLGRQVGYLPQDVELFAGTVADNIARLEPDPDPDLVVEAARTAGVHQLVLALPKGYATEIGDAGSFLSGGQRQRIGLARALYGRPRLIVLDEPNASLDSEGEEALIQAMHTAKDWGATVVLVAHQPRILSPCDKILILRGGAVELFGPRDEVMAKLRAAPVPTRAPAPAAATARALRPISVRVDEPAASAQASVARG
jgi:PrtD family type I secretion system ABC transporter